MSDEDKKPLTVVTSRVINNMIAPRKNKSRKVHVPTYLLTPKPKKAKGQKWNNEN